MGFSYCVGEDGFATSLMPEPSAMLVFLPMLPVRLRGLRRRADAELPQIKVKGLAVEVGFREEPVRLQDIERFELLRRRPKFYIAFKSAPSGHRVSRL
jgi:hypothetical protein